MPAVLKVSLVLRLVVCRVEIVDTTLQAGVHDSEVLIRKGYVNYKIRLEGTHQSDKGFNVVSVYLCRLYPVTAYSVGYLVTFGFRTACQHDVCEHIILGYLVCHYCSYTAGTDN